MKAGYQIDYQNDQREHDYCEDCDGYSGDDDFDDRVKQMTD